MEQNNDSIIGTLNEHTLHLALKNYFEPDETYHECKVGTFVADIKRDDGIIEIETVSFTNIKRKLGAFLKEYPVTVVYPIAVKKSIVWIDPKTHEMTKKHKSPKKGRPSDVLFELFKLKDHLTDGNFRLTLVMCETVDYKLRNGWSRDGKRGGRREERVPVSFFGTVEIKKPEDYEKLFDAIPEGEFTSAEFSKANKLHVRYAWYGLKILCIAGVIEQCGKKGNAYLYRRSQDFVKQS